MPQTEGAVFSPRVSRRRGSAGGGWRSLTSDMPQTEYSRWRIALSHLGYATDGGQQAEGAAISPRVCRRRRPADGEWRSLTSGMPQTEANRRRVALSHLGYAADGGRRFLTSGMPQTEGDALSPRVCRRRRPADGVWRSRTSGMPQTEASRRRMALSHLGYAADGGCRSLTSGMPQTEASRRRMFRVTVSIGCFLGPMYSLTASNTSARTRSPWVSYLLSVKTTSHIPITTRNNGLLSLHTL